MSDLTALFDELIQAHALGRFEEVLLSGPLGSEKVKRHPLGFTVVQLKVGTESLRLHLWKGADISQPGFEIHNHTFELQSYVIDGTLRHRTYRAFPDPDGDFAVYEVSYEPDASLMTKTNQRARIEVETDRIFGAGESYAVAASSLHDAVLHNCLSATTLVMTRDFGGSPITYGPAGGEVTLRALRNPLSEDTLATLGLTGARSA